MEEQQPILRSTPRGEEQQRQLIGDQHLLVVKAECDLPVALGQMPCQLEDVLGADAPSAPQRGHRLGVTVGTYLSEFAPRPDHAASRPFRRFCGKEMTLPIAPSEALPVAPPEPLPRCFASAARSRSASRATASRRCSSLNGTRCGARSLKSVRLFSHAGPGRGARTRSNGDEAESVSHIEKRFQPRKVTADTDTAPTQHRHAADTAGGSLVNWPLPANASGRYTARL